MAKFLRLTNRETGRVVYVEESSICVMTALTERDLHENDFGITKEKLREYDDSVAFTCIATQGGVIHVVEEIEDIVAMCKKD